MKTTTYEKILLSLGLALVSAPLYSKYSSNKTQSVSSLSSIEAEATPNMRRTSSVDKPKNEIEKTSANDDQLNQEYLAYIKSLENQAQTVASNKNYQDNAYSDLDESQESDYDYENETNSRGDYADYNQDEFDYEYEDENEVADVSEYEDSEEVAASSSEDNYVN